MKTLGSQDPSENALARGGVTPSGIAIRVLPLIETPLVSATGPPGVHLALLKSRSLSRTSSRPMWVAPIVTWPRPSVPPQRALPCCESLPSWVGLPALAETSTPS